jgi:hypothetical protein
MAKPAARPRTPKSTPQPPEQVKSLLGETTSRLRQLDVQGECAEITRIYKLSVHYNLGLHRGDPNIIAIGKAGETTIGHIGGPTAKFVIKLNTPDAIIHAEFKRWLAEVRTHIKLPIAKSGRHALNSKFDKNKFDAWRSAGIVQFADLLA